MASALKVLIFALLPNGAVVQRQTGESVYLTFDDGPDPDYTPRLLDALAASDAKATFFVQGQCVMRHPRVARRIVEDGHAVASHGWSHRRLPHWAFRRAWDEFAKAKEAIREVVGVDTILYRPPYGWVTLPMLAYAATGRMKLILWSVDSDDDRTHSPAAVLAKGRHVQRGDIFLCHDDNGAILQALPSLLGEWRSRGLETRALGEDESVRQGFARRSRGD